MDSSIMKGSENVSESTDQNISIQHYVSKKDSSNLYSTDNWLLLVLRSGFMEIQYDDNIIRLKSNQMIILPINKEVRFTVKKDMCDVVYTFYEQLMPFNKLFIDDLCKKSYLSKGNPKSEVLDLHIHLQKVIDIQYEILAEKTITPDLSTIFVNQLFGLINMYYSKEELIRFFSVMRASCIDFKKYILLNYENKDIQTLADECNMSIPTFNRYFRSNFGESALQWLNKKKAEIIYREIISSVKTFAEIAYDNNFSSTSYLTAFCKRYFDLTPDQIRRISHK